MSSSKKNWPVQGLCGRCLSEFIDWRYCQSCWYFRPSIVNCCSSNVLSGSTLPPSSLCKKNTLYTYTVCTDKHLPQSPFTGQFSRWSTFCIAIYGSYLYTDRLKELIPRHVFLSVWRAFCRSRSRDLLFQVIMREVERSELNLPCTARYALWILP